MAQPSKFSKLLIGVKNACAHKTVPKFECVDIERDGNYKLAADMFLEFRSQLREIIQHLEEYRNRMKDAAYASSLIAQDFNKISRRRIIRGSQIQPWESVAAQQIESLLTATGENEETVNRIFFRDTEQHLLLELKHQFEQYDVILKMIRERYMLKVELEHYSSKVQSMSESARIPEEKKIRNIEKYAIANNRLKERTAFIMQKFADVESFRRIILEEDLPRLMDFQKTAYMIMASNSEKAMDGMISEPTNFSKNSLQYSTNISYRSEARRHNRALTHRSRISFEKSINSPVRSTSDASLKSRRERSTTHMARPSCCPVDAENYETLALSHSMQSHISEDSSDRGRSTCDREEAMCQEYNLKEVQNHPRASAAPQPIGDNITVAETPDMCGRGASMATVDEKLDVSTNGSRGDAAESENSADGSDDENALEDADGLFKVIALHNYEAREEGDLSFSAGDIIFTNEEQWSTGGWAAGICNGRSGLFPSNYTKCVD